jgi:hypothetical protein
MFSGGEQALHYIATQRERQTSVLTVSQVATGEESGLGIRVYASGAPSCGRRRTRTTCGCIVMVSAGKR